MFGWMYFFPSAKPTPKPVPHVAAEESAETTNALAQVVEGAAPELSAPLAEEGAKAGDEAVVVLEDAQLLLLSNDRIELKVSSHGGAVVSAVFISKNDDGSFKYPEVNKADSGPVVLDFASAPALRYDGLPLTNGILTETDGGLVYTESRGDGKVFKRTLSLEGDYLLTVQDEFVNSTDDPWMLPELRLPTGPMINSTNTTATKGILMLGVDTSVAKDEIDHWGKKINKLAAGERTFTSTPEMLEVTQQSVNWIAAKNKFFVQVLTPEQGTTSGFDLTVRRDMDGKKLTEVEVAGAVQFSEKLIAAGAVDTRSAQMYIGPKKFSALKDLGKRQSAVMEFESTGFWSFMSPIMYPIKLALLWGLTHFAILGNYGIAILILTVLVRVIFWPLTHKSTESMKRMQELQPKMKELKEKYKDNPQRMQQETMALYKENKVNPMGGCLPMLIQIPVFIALFAVLRSAIELRFSKFLWISDLSEPENLFQGAFKVPLIGWDSLNILPLLMAATMMLQQKLTPTAAAATPEQQQQQKMMQTIMPVMMLFFFYTMPSGLVLYWTTSQVIMIAQLLIRKKKAA
jgi:YidC/Oxa1 family membrane protein insertase